MSRRVEGTTTRGFCCDAVGCSEHAIYAPVLCVPYEGAPPHDCLVNYLDIHTCQNHWSHAKQQVDITSAMEGAVRLMAAKVGRKPDFSRAYVLRISVYESDYQSFQVAAGLVPPDDAMAKGKIAPL